jgi:hypothetical protein
VAWWRRLGLFGKPVGECWDDAVRGLKTSGDQRVVLRWVSARDQGGKAGDAGLLADVEILPCFLVE